jgi:hypothetical protein
MSGYYFDLSHVDLASLTKIVQESVPDATEEEIEQFVDADWPNAEEHQEWLDTATVKEIADWVAGVLMNTHV